ncbi:Uncharacterised protein [Mycolicibacterium aichiense]|nr:Uncharacterised protein [Mycolicibacterium aichiense]
MALDQAFAELDGQHTELAGLQSKAKDIIGLLTLAATFLGAFGKAYSDSVLHSVMDMSGWVLAAFVMLPVVTALAAIYVMKPRSGWMFTLDGSSMATDMRGRAPDVKFQSAESLYLAYVGKITELLDANQPHLKRRKWALWTALLTLLCTVAFTGGLVLTSHPVKT